MASVGADLEGVSIDNSVNGNSLAMYLKWLPISTPHGGANAGNADRR